MPVIPLYKPLGWTPLQMLDLLRDRRPDLRDQPMTYAGRLDPMAEGLLLVLVGEDRFQKPDFIKLDKTYVAEFLFGIETDSYDSLGLIQSLNITSELDPEKAEREIIKFEGIQKLSFPPFSAYKVNGAPLHYWARMGKIHEVEIPKKNMVIRSVEILDAYKKEAGSIRREAKERILQAQGAFRQDETVQNWREKFEKIEGEFLVVKARLNVGSGTYIRALAHEVGKRLGVGACLFSLKRESVGDWLIEDSLKLN